MSATSIPVVLVGRLGEMGRIVAANLLHEVEVIHFIASPDTARKDLPLLLANQKPANQSDDNIGTQSYVRPIEAILLGLGYTNEIVEELREACNGIGKGVPWLSGGISKEEFDNMIANNPPLPPKQQGPITAAKMKTTLIKLLEEGKGGVDGLYQWYEG